MDWQQKYGNLLSASELARLGQAVQRPLPPALRVNTLKTTMDQARRHWPNRYGWETRPVPFCATGWQIIRHDHDVARTLEHRMGYYYIQNAASMLPVELFPWDDVPLGDNTSWPLVLDLAAAPGGKTTHLVSKMNDRGLVIANDSSARRCEALRVNLQDWGATCAAVTQYRGERFGGWFPELFDQVLLDAPCSGESLRSSGGREQRLVSARERRALHRRQVRLLTSAFQATRPGGQVVYATCTLALQEDEAVLDALLRRFPHQAAIESVDQRLPVPAPGLRSDGRRTFHPQVGRAVRLWPHLYDTSGFFAALIRKQDSVPVASYPPPSRTLANAGLKALDRREKRRVVAELQTYGFDLPAVLGRHALTLWQRERTVHAIPELYLSHFATLPCLALGMRLGAWEKDRFVPSHELVARFSAQFTARRLALSPEQSRLWMEGRDLRGLTVPHYPLGSVILLKDDQDRFLGRGKLLRQRIRNLLLKRLIA